MIVYMNLFIISLISLQMYNVILNWKKKFAHFKTHAHSFIVFSFFCQFLTDSMEGIELQNGSYQQRHHPLVIDVLQIGDMVESEDVALTGKHQQGRHQKQHIADQHHPTESTDGHIRTVVRLLHLHSSETQSPQSKYIGRWTPCQQTCASTADHHQATYQENDALYPTQLSHC